MMCGLHVSVCTSSWSACAVILALSASLWSAHAVILAWWRSVRAWRWVDGVAPRYCGISPGKAPRSVHKCTLCMHGIIFESQRTFSTSSKVLWNRSWQSSLECAQSVEVDTLIERVNLDSGVGSRGQCMPSTLTCSAETAEGTRIGRQILLASANPGNVVEL